MPIVAASSRSRRKIRFPQSKRPATATSVDLQRGDALDQLRVKTFDLNLNNEQEGKTGDMSFKTREKKPEIIPVLFTEVPVLQDSLTTKTSGDQDETVEKCLPFLRGTDGTLRDNLNDFGLSHLFKERHIEYLYDSLEDYPQGFVAMDSSRPWMSYWALAGLVLLGEDVSKYRER